MNRVCYRCDWEGRTVHPTCPRCGARLHRAGDGRHPRAEGREAGPAPSGAGPEEAPVRRVPAWVVLAGLAAVAAAVALPVLRAGREGRAPGSGPPALSGRLVYAGAPGQARLFVYDLLTGMVTLGPRVPEPIAVVRSGAGPGWLGLTVQPPGGPAAAYVLKGLSPGARASLVAQGDAVAWRPGGRVVVAVESERVRNERCADGFDRRVRVVSVDVATGTREVLHEEEVPCGEVASMGAEEVGVFVTRVSAGEARVYRLGYGPARSVLRNYAVVSVSPVGDLLVTPWDALAGIPAPDPGGPVRYWTGLGALVEVGDDTGDLLVERVLAWSARGERAAVLGRLGDRRGVWVLEAGPGDDRRVPAPFGPATSGPAGASFSPEGALFAVIDGRAYALVGDVTVQIGLGPEAAAFGPVAWMP